MKKYIAIVLCASLITACDKEAGREAGESYTETRTVSCSYTGYCMDCALGFDGKFNCTPGLKLNCSGEQKVEGVVTPVTVRYESGSVRKFNDFKTTKELSSCGSNG